MGFNSGLFVFVCVRVFVFFVFWWLWVDFVWGAVADFGGLGSSNCGNGFEFVGSDLEVGLDVVDYVFAFAFAFLFLFFVFL